MICVFVVPIKSTKNVVGDKMNNKKSRPDDLTAEVLLADAMLRLTVLEKILIEKGIFSKDELKSVSDKLVENITKVILEKINSSNNLDDFINLLGKSSEKN